MARTQQECIAAAGRALAVALERREALSPREAAEAAHRTGGPSVDELEVRIIAQRAASPSETDGARM